MRCEADQGRVNAALPAGSGHIALSPKLSKAVF